LKLIGKYKNAIRMKVSVIAPPATVYKKRDWEWIFIAHSSPVTMLLYYRVQEHVYKTEKQQMSFENCLDI
jgi:hypothetical protein